MIDDIEEEIEQWPGTHISMHKYGGIQFNVGDKEIGHIHGNGAVDMLLSLKIKNELLKEGKVNDHHTFKNSGWITYYLNDKDKSAYPIRLFKLSYDLKKQGQQVEMRKRGKSKIIFHHRGTGSH